MLTHVDVPGPAKDECIELLKQLTAASRNEPGVLRFDVVQQDSRPNHFTVVETWRDRGAYDAHVMADHTRALPPQADPDCGRALRRAGLRAAPVGPEARFETACVAARICGWDGSGPDP